MPSVQRGTVTRRSSGKWGARWRDENGKAAASTRARRRSSRRMGTSVEMIDETYGHLVADADGFERGLLDAFDSRIARTPREIEAEAVSQLTPI